MSDSKSFGLEEDGKWYTDSIYQLKSHLELVLTTSFIIVLTKGSLFSDALRATEKAKIDCGGQHFKAMESGVAYEVTDGFESFLDVAEE